MYVFLLVCSKVRKGFLSFNCFQEKKCSPAFIRESVLKEHKVIVSYQLIYRIATKSMPAQMKALNSDSLEISVNALMALVNQLGTFFAKITLDPSGRIKRLTIIDLAAVAEFAVAPEMLQIDFTANSTTCDMPMLLVSIFNSSGNHTCLAVSWTENEERATQEDVLLDVAECAGVELMKLVRIIGKFNNSNSSNRSFLFLLYLRL